MYKPTHKGVVTLIDFLHLTVSFDRNRKHCLRGNTIIYLMQFFVWKKGRYALIKPYFLIIIFFIQLLLMADICNCINTIHCRLGTLFSYLRLISMCSSLANGEPGVSSRKRNWPYEWIWFVLLQHFVRTNIKFKTAVYAYDICCGCVQYFHKSCDDCHYVIHFTFI